MEDLVTGHPLSPISDILSFVQLLPTLWPFCSFLKPTRIFMPQGLDTSYLSLGCSSPRSLQISYFIYLLKYPLPAWPSYWVCSSPYHPPSSDPAFLSFFFFFPLELISKHYVFILCILHYTVSLIFAKRVGKSVIISQSLPDFHDLGDFENYRLVIFSISSNVGGFFMTRSMLCIFGRSNKK